MKIFSLSETDSSSENEQINSNSIPLESFEKKCTKCNETKSVTQFARRNNKHTITRSSWCKNCESLKSLKWQKDNPEKAKARRDKWTIKNPEKKRFSQIKHKYKISFEHYQDLVTHSDNRCYICNESANKRHLHVDHDHKTGQVRGLLCHNCNTGLGLVNEDIDIIKRMISYLEKHQ